MNSAKEIHNFRTFGWLPEIPDHRDLLYGKTLLLDEAKLEAPPLVDLRILCPPVYNQANLLSCTPSALATAFQLELKKQNLPIFFPSRLFLYFNARFLEHSDTQNIGVYVRDGIKALNLYGVCREEEWDYNVNRYSERPSETCYQHAIGNRAVSYYRINNSNIAELKACLSAGFTFAFGFTIYPSFFSADKNGGVVPYPGNESPLGGHTVLAVGYDEQREQFIVRSSWGADCGDHGYYYMPYAYLTTQSLSDDFWTIRVVSSDVREQLVS